MNHNKIQCRICGNQTNNSLQVFREKMFGTNEPFDYIQCSNCGCMQLLDEHIDMHAHYPNDYFSFNYKYKPNKIKDFIGKQHLAYKTGRFSIFGFFSNLFFKNLAQSWILKEYISFDSKILDVGCGSGRLLHLLSKRGFNHLTGVEPFNKEKIILDDKVVIFNNSIFEIEGKYDFIMLHYSFEHMPDPQKVIEKIINLLEENGTLLIRIPLIDSYAWRKYQTNWVQMDAPRHIYLHTFKSIVYLCNLQGLKLQNVIYDSSEYQFIQSEKYMRGLTFNNDFTVSKKDKKYFRNFATQLNKQKDGDQASFYFKKQN